MNCNSYPIGYSLLSKETKRKLKEVINKMGNVKDEAMGYEPKAKVKNISELPSVETDVAVLEDTEAEFPYKYIEIEGERYRVPLSVLGSLKAILEENPNLKKFKVKKSGEGMETRYTVIPLS